MAIRAPALLLGVDMSESVVLWQSGVCVDVPGPCYHQGLCRCPWSGPLPEALCWLYLWLATTPATAGLAPHLGSAVKLTLTSGDWASLPKDLSESDLALPLVCWGGASGRERSLALPLVTCSRWERWPSGHESGWAIPASHWLQPLGEQTLPLPWGARQS